MKTKLRLNKVIYPKVLIYSMAVAMGWQPPMGMLPRSFGYRVRTQFIPLKLEYNA